MIAARRKVLLILFFLAALILAGCGDRTVRGGEETMKVSVEVAHPEKIRFRDSLTFPGVTAAPLTTTPAFMVPGKVTKLFFNVGEQVRKGDTLALLEPDIYQNQVNTAMASVHVAEAGLQKVQAGSREQQKEMARQQFMQATHNLDLARIEKNRFESLYNIDAIPRRQYDQVLAQYRIADDQTKAAREAYDLTREGASKEDRLMASSNVELARTGAASASTQLSYTRLVSHTDGVIVEKKTETGTVVGAGVPVYEISSTGHTDFVVMIPSVHIGRIKMGQKADVCLFGEPDTDCSGRVYEIKTSSEAPLYSCRVKLRLTGAGRALSGQMGKAVFSTGAGSLCYSLPLRCLVKNGKEKQYRVFTVNDRNEAVPAPVEVVKVKDDRVIIKGGCSPDTRVVVSGQEYLKDGTAVTIVDALESRRKVSPDMEPAPKESEIRI